MTILTGGYWFPARDADPRARALFDRHYSRRSYRDGRRPAKFIGPGEYMLLVSRDYDAMFAWRLFRDDALWLTEDGSALTPHGVNCAIFRNESATLSSTLIREACEIASRRWPGRHAYTYVNPRRIRSRNPGCCFLKAGWSRVGATRRGLIVLETRFAY
jgi:hypothetical protein